MVYIVKMSREQSKAVDTVLEAQHKQNNPAPAPCNPIYSDMQNIVDKSKRGEKL